VTQKKSGKQQKPSEEPMVVVPDRYAEEDLIGYSDYGDGLVQMIRSVQSDGSFTIGVFGQWGQGKTSMLRQIKHALDESPDKSEPIITAWFNPWQFTKEEHIIIPFFHTLASYFEDYNEENKTITEKTKKRIGLFLEELAHVPIALAYGLKTSADAPLLLKLDLSLKDTIEEARRHKKKVGEKAISEDQKVLKKYESLYYRLISRLENASNELGLKVVIFIDDLDRCLPEKAIDLLEGIKVLLDIPGFVFVIGVAREVIERGIRVRYYDLYKDLPKQEIFLEEEYLDKIIQFPFTLPAPDKELLEKLVEELLNKVPKVKPYLKIIHKALGNNPRCLKRFVNNLSYTFWVAEAKRSKVNDKKIDFHSGLLVKMTLLAFLFPQLYHIIGKTPSHLLRIQDYLRFKSQIDGKKEEGKLTEEEQKRTLAENNVQHPDVFIEIKELHLFDRPRLDTITIVLGEEPSKQGKGVEENLLFEDEEEVRKYVSLLTATSKQEESCIITGNTILDTIAKRMVKVRAGKITLLDERSGNEFNTKIKGFLLDIYPVTQDLYRQITGENPSSFEGNDRPVEGISWFDAVKFCNLLSDKAGYERFYQINGQRIKLNEGSSGFRLPFEAEWEYACRAGTNDDRYGELDDIAWYRGNSGGQSHGVGRKSPNNWGLYDMLGNVWEWCWDWFDIYPKGDKELWRGPESGESRVFRGGSWFISSVNCRCAYRNLDHPANCVSRVGFRLARSL
jgi:formylglycine-generating enzyme required for sulfatase activity